MGGRAGAAFWWGGLIMNGEAAFLVAENAKRLLDDAKYLMQEKRCRSAVALSILAIEEVGKIRAGFTDQHNEKIGCAFALAKNNSMERLEKIKDANFIQLTDKNFAGEFKKNIKLGIKKVELMVLNERIAEADINFFTEIFDEQTSRQLNNIKKASFYADQSSDYISEVTDPAFVKNLIEIADMVMKACLEKVDATERLPC